ncbi:MAG TPA: prolyl oligopeptidase family serine peptidase [Thermoanaerobaculia bacterium]|nr:prolyl oligopeptidase family serine peptidase [Thermoanaerobaculia bacterium]
MRRTLFLLLPLALLLAVPALAAGLPPAISGLSFSPDGGQVLVSMDTDGVPNAYALPVAGGPPVQLTRSAKDPVWALSYFPADERILYRSGPAGDEDHLFVRELDGKAVELVPGKAPRFAGWAGDGRALWVEIDNLGAQSRDLYRVETDGYKRTLVHRNSSNLARLAAVSPDGRFLAFVESNNDLIRNLRIKDLQGGREKAQTAGEGFTVYIPLSFSPDSTALLTLTDSDRGFATHGFRALNRVDLATGKRRGLLQKSWDVLDALYSPDGKRIAVIAGGDTRSSLELYDAQTLQPVGLPGLPPIGDVTRAVFSRDGRRLAFLASGSATPPAVWVYNLAEPGPPSRLGTAPEGGGWVEGEVKRFKSFDGREIAGILYKPRQAAPDHKTPAVVWIHDGPSGQSRLEFDPLFQTLVQRGYAVYAVNERGSFGYGRIFQQLDDRQHGLQDLKDCVAAKAMLAATGWVDPGRIAVGGVGFGGFLTLTALAFSPREFAAGVDLFGISNWQRVMDTLPFHSSERLVLADEMGHAGNAGLERTVPHDRAGDIVRPLLIVQGARDTLAIPSEAADIATAMKSKGRVVEEIVLPDAAHGLVLRADRERVYNAVGDFLDRNLKAVPAK